MFYVCSKEYVKLDKNHDDLNIGVFDTSDGTTTYVTERELKGYIKQGVKILGCSEFGVMQLTERQFRGYAELIKLASRFNKECNGGKKYWVRMDAETWGNVLTQSIKFEYSYSGGFGGGSYEYVFILRSTGDIEAYYMTYSSALAANVSGYNGNFSTRYVLYFGEKPIDSIHKADYYKYYKSASAMYAKLVGKQNG